MRGGVRMLGTAARPIAAGVRRLSATPGLTVIGWHRVDGQQSDGLSTGVDDFRRHLDTLDDWGAHVLPLDEAVLALEAGTLPDRAVALTFDDGYASVVGDRLADPARSRPAGDPVRGLRLPDRRPPVRLGRARAAPRPAPAGACGRAPGGRGRRVRHRLPHRVAPVAAPPRPRCGQARARGLAGGARGAARATGPLPRLPDRRLDACRTHRRGRGRLPGRHHRRPGPQHRALRRTSRCAEPSCPPRSRTCASCSTAPTRCCARSTRGADAGGRHGDRHRGRPDEAADDRPPTPRRRGSRRPRRLCAVAGAARPARARGLRGRDPAAGLGRAGARRGLGLRGLRGPRRAERRQGSRRPPGARLGRTALPRSPLRRTAQPRADRRCRLRGRAAPGDRAAQQRPGGARRAAPLRRLPRSAVRPRRRDAEWAATRAACPGLRRGLRGGRGLRAAGLRARRGPPGRWTDR